MDYVDADSAYVHMGLHRASSSRRGAGRRVVHAADTADRQLRLRQPLHRNAVLSTRLDRGQLPPDRATDPPGHAVPRLVAAAPRQAGGG